MATYKIQTGEAGEVEKNDTNPNAKGWGTTYMSENPETLLRSFIDGVNNDMVDTENMFLRVIVEK